MIMTEASVVSTKTSRWIAFGFLGKKIMLLYLIIMIAVGIMSIIDNQLLPLFIVLLAVYLVLFLARLFGMKKEIVELSTQRLTIKRRYGPLRKTITIPLNHVAVFELEQSKRAKRFKFGSMVIYTTGHFKVNIESIAKVEELHENLHIELTKQWRQQET